MALLIPRILAALLCAHLLIAAPPAHAQPSSADASLHLNEQKIKAGLVYNFLKSTSWPASSFSDAQTINVCLIGGDPFDGYLHPLNGRTAQKYKIELHVLSAQSNLDRCHLAVIHDNQESRLPALLDKIGNAPILTASSIPQFARRGGMLEFGTKQQHIHLYLNPAQLRKAQLQMDDKLVRLMEVVSP